MTVEHFDAWYVAMAANTLRDRMWQEHLGLPPEVVSSSLLTLAGLREIAGWLRLRPGDVLLDLACGRGGYGMWLARETGCRVIGLDFSPVAVADAARRVDQFGLAGRASYLVGDLTATGLEDACVDAVLCVDAIQFASDLTAAAREVLRVLRPGRVAALSCWEPHDVQDPGLPERIRRLDVGRALREAGFDDVTTSDRPEWLAVEQRLWDAVLALDPGDDQSLRDAREEGERMRPMLPNLRRVLSTGRRPR